MKKQKKKAQKLNEQQQEGRRKPRLKPVKKVKYKQAFYYRDEEE